MGWHHRRKPLQYHGINAKRPATDLSAPGVNGYVGLARRKPNSSPKATLFVIILSFSQVVSPCNTTTYRVRVPFGRQNESNPVRTQSNRCWGALWTPIACSSEEWVIQVSVARRTLESHTRVPWGRNRLATPMISFRPFLMLSSRRVCRLRSETLTDTVPSACVSSRLVMRRPAKLGASFTGPGSQFGTRRFRSSASGTGSNTVATSERGVDFHGTGRMLVKRCTETVTKLHTETAC